MPAPSKSLLSWLNWSKRTARRLVVAAITACTAVGTAACGDASSPATTATARVLLSDSLVSVRVGDDAAVSASARDAAGQDLVGRRVFWSSRDTTVATVSQAGVIHGVAPGSTQISANTEGQSALATVAVVARPLASLVADPATAQLTVGASQRLAARATNDRGTPVNTPITWTSLDPGVVGVAADGTITALAVGVGSVRASADSLTAVTVVVVTPVPVASARVTPATAALVVGATQQLTAAAYDAAGNTLAGRTVAWTSQDPGVAATSSTGQVTAIAPGTATIAATIEGQTATAVVTVRQAPVAGVTVSPATGSVGVGGSVGLSATTTDANGNALAGRAVAWTSSASTIARVDQAGVVTGVAAGSATITATSEGVTGSATVRVVAPPATSVASVVVTPATAALTVGDTRALTATARASDGSTITGRAVTWSSSATNVASVSSTGVVTAVAAGSASISATVDGITGTAAVTVQPQSVASVVVSPAAASVQAGATTQLAATPRGASGNALSGRVVTWSSNNTSVATVTSGGLVTAVGPGSVTISATSEGVTGTAAVTVTAVVFVSPTTATIRDRGQPRTTQLAATDQTGRVLLPTEVTWSSANPGAATVSASGLVSGVSSGSGTATTVITVTYHGATATATITVTH